MKLEEEIVRKGRLIDTVQLWVQRKAICKISSFSSDLNLLWSSAYLIAKTRSSCGCWTIPYQDNIVCIQLSICGAYHWSSPSWSFIQSRSPRCGDIYDFFGYFKWSDIGMLLDLLFDYFLDCFSSRLYKILDFQDFCHDLGDLWAREFLWKKNCCFLATTKFIIWCSFKSLQKMEV